MIIIIEWPRNRHSIMALLWLLLLGCCNIGALGGRRRVELEKLLSRIEWLGATERTHEVRELLSHAKAIWRGKNTKLARVNVSIPRFESSLPSAGELMKIVASNYTADGASGTRSRLSLRIYLARAAKPASSARGTRRRRTSTTRVFVGRGINWDGGGVTALGRCLGLVLLPVRTLYELLRLVACNSTRALARRHRLDTLARVADQVDYIMRRGPFKSLPEFYPVLDLARNGRTSKYYAHGLDYTRSARYAARIAWRMPADIGAWLAIRYVALSIADKHQRLEAALLRAARDELRRVLRRRRRLKNIL